MILAAIQPRSAQGRVVRHRLMGYGLDWLAFVFSGYLAFALRFDGSIPAPYWRPMEAAVTCWSFCQAITFFLARLDRGSWRLTSAYDVLRIVLANTCAITAASLVILWFGWNPEPKSVYILEWFISNVMVLLPRFSVRIFATREILPADRSKLTRTLIYGAGAAGLALLWELRQNRTLMCEVIGFIDDDPSKHHLVLQGKPVFAGGEFLEKVVQEHEIARVLIAIPSASGLQMARILKYAMQADVEYKTVPGLAELIEGVTLGRQIRSVAVEDLLGRQPVQIDQEGIRTQLQGKMVLVTGAAGSIGSELCRQIAHFRPLGLVGLDAAETPLFHIDRELKQNFPELEFYPELCNITCKVDLERLLAKYRPAVVCHAAAYKHVPMMERHIFAAVENNIFGTWNVATAAAGAGVEDFVMISTDKAVGPTSVMGASKRIAELLIHALQRDRTTRFVAVRFGNVLGSNGSVVPIFKEQIAAGGPVTVTHPEITRYFMTIPEASQLVLQALSFRKGGETFVLDMGEPIKIVELAKNLILLSGLRPEIDIPIQFTGLRPGEKLYEELSLGEEKLVATAHRKIRSFMGNTGPGIEEVQDLLGELEEIVRTRDSTRLLALLKSVIPDYKPGSSIARNRLGMEPLSLSAKGQSRETAGKAIPLSDLNYVGGRWQSNLPIGVQRAELSPQQRMSKPGFDRI